MITLRNISFSYKGTKENNLYDISLHIPKGQCVLLCGGSGCGKTTLTRLINGLIPHFFEGEFPIASVRSFKIQEHSFLIPILIVKSYSVWKTEDFLRNNC